MLYAMAAFAFFFILVAVRFYRVLDPVAADFNRAQILQWVCAALSVISIVPLLYAGGVGHPHPVLLAVWLGSSGAVSIVMFTLQTKWYLTKVLALLLAVSGPLLALRVVHVI